MDLIFSLLWDHLLVSDMFRLSRALCHHHTKWSTEDIRSARVMLSIPPRIELTSFLATMLDRARCRRCGMVCHRTPPRYCQVCTRYDLTSPVLLVDRNYIFTTYRGLKSRRILERVRVVKRGGNQAFLYWKADVDAVGCRQV